MTATIHAMHRPGASRVPLLPMERLALRALREFQPELLHDIATRMLQPNGGWRRAAAFWWLDRAGECRRLSRMYQCSRLWLDQHADAMCHVSQLGDCCAVLP